MNSNIKYFTSLKQNIFVFKIIINNQLTVIFNGRNLTIKIQIFPQNNILNQQMQQDIWSQLRQKLPFQLTLEQTKKRNIFWQDFDIKENGYITLEQAQKGCYNILHLPGMFQIKPVLRKAYDKAKNTIISFQKNSDDFVSKAEFRFLLKYLRQYYQYWVAFNRIDTDKDLSIDLNQFKKALPVMARWGIKIKSDQQAKKIFLSIDINNGGTVIFNQFVQWAIKINLDLDDDDNYV